MSQRTIRLPENRRRPGAVLLVVLASLSLLSLLAGTMLRGAMLGRQAFRAEQHARQADELLLTALQRASRRVVQSGAFQEQTVLSADELVGSGSARLTLTAEPLLNEAAAGSWLLGIDVEYPLEGPQPVRRRKTVLLLPDARPSPSSESSP
jgi:Tfp pilus assembly protein PilX